MLIFKEVLEARSAVWSEAATTAVRRRRTFDELKFLFHVFLRCVDINLFFRFVPPSFWVSFLLFSLSFLLFFFVPLRAPNNRILPTKENPISLKCSAFFCFPFSLSHLFSCFAFSPCFVFLSFHIFHLFSH